MSTHITSPPRAGQTGPVAAEPAPRATRFDERGIALQTVIILVVMLAIAGAIAAVLLNRGGEAADQLQAADFGLPASDLDTASSCRSAGHGWHGANNCKSLAQTNGAGTHTNDDCKGFNPRWIVDPGNAGDCKVA